MLPGSPYRVPGGAALPELNSKEPPAKVDPTSLKPHEVNPFTGEGV